MGTILLAVTDALSARARAPKNLTVEDSARARPAVDWMRWAGYTDR